MLLPRVLAARASLVEDGSLAPCCLRASGGHQQLQPRRPERRPFSPSPTARPAALRPGPGADQGRKGMTGQGKGKQGKQGKKGKKGKERRVHFEDDDRRGW